MKKSIATILMGLFVLVSFVFTSCTKKEEVIKIGISLPLSGNAAVYGVAMKNGIELAYSELKNKNQFELVYEDDQGTAQKSVSAINKLINIDDVKLIIGGAMSSTAESIIPLTEKNSVMLISPTATKPSLTEGTNCFIRLWPSDNYDGKIMADFAYNHLKISKIAILYVNVAYGQGVSSVFQREFEKLGGIVAISEGYNENETNFKMIIKKISKSKPDAVYLPGYVTEVTTILKQAKELDFNTQFLGVNSFFDNRIIDIAQDAAEGSIFTYPEYDVKSEDKEIATFVENYKLKYNELPDAFAAQGYDALKVATASLEAIDDYSGKNLKAKILNMKEYNGPGGKMIFLDNGDVEKKLRLMIVEGKQFKNYDRLQ